MEVFIKDEDKKLIRKYPNNVYRLKTINNKTKEFDTVECEINSLDQHDAEVRADERKEVVAELQEWNDKLIDEGYIIDYEYLQQKLAELKGE